MTVISQEVSREATCSSYVLLHFNEFSDQTRATCSTSKNTEQTLCKYDSKKMIWRNRKTAYEKEEGELTSYVPTTKLSARDVA